jgi:hypothetical protein
MDDARLSRHQAIAKKLSRTTTYLPLFHFSHPETFQLTHIKNTAVCTNNPEKLLFPAGIHRTFAPTNRISSAKCEWITFNNKKVKRYEKTD